MFRRILTALTLVVLTGCGGSLPPAANPDQAQNALRIALTAWQNGETLEGLKDRWPAINMSDPDWRTGRKLASFELRQGTSNGQGWRCEAVLTFQDDPEGLGPQLASYAIDTSPALVVIREEI